MADRNPTVPHVVIVGAGPGGVTAALLLAARGVEVTVFEKKDQIGGRNAELRLGPYSFDVGPTFLMMRFLLDEVFEEAGLSSDDYMEFVRLEPMYRLQFHDNVIEPTTVHDTMVRRLEEAFPGSSAGYEKYLQREAVRFERMLPCLQKPYNTLLSMVSKDLLKALPKLSIGRSLFGELGKYFDDDELRLSFTFQSKYLGMSPWECPAAFAILSYVEHAHGIWHTIGGLNKISDGIARAAREKGATIHLETPVDKVIVKDGAACGVRLESGDVIEADDVIINADFATAMTELVPPDALKKYTRKRLHKMRYSCSTFMLYLGLDTLYEDMPHHTILFAGNYRENVEDIFDRMVLSDECSLYVRNASLTDPTLAPEGHSALYVLVPVPNRDAAIDWDAERDGFRDRIITSITQRAPMPGLADHIVEEQVIVPDDWTTDYDVYKGATFNLAHNLGQMLYFRPRNRFEEFDNCYLAGGGTHPGSGMPTIIESGRIAANMLCRARGVPFTSKNIQA